MTTLATSDLSAGSYTPEQRFAGDSDIITKPAVIKQAGAIAAGSVLGRITATGKLVVCDTAAADGSEVPAAILAEAVDTTSADVTAAVYLAGEFNLDWLVFHASFTTEAEKLDAFGLSGSIVIRKLGYSG